MLTIINIPAGTWLRLVNVEVMPAFRAGALTPLSSGGFQLDMELVAWYAIAGLGLVSDGVHSAPLRGQSNRSLRYARDAFLCLLVSVCMSPPYGLPIIYRGPRPRSSNGAHEYSANDITLFNNPEQMSAKSVSVEPTVAFRSAGADRSQNRMSGISM